MRTRAGDCLREAIEIEHVDAVGEVFALQMYGEDWLDVLRMVESFEVNMDRQLTRWAQQSPIPSRREGRS